MTPEQAVEKLNEIEKGMYALGHAQSILYVDGDTVAPKNSWKGRGMALGYLVKCWKRSSGIRKAWMRRFCAARN